MTSYGLGRAYERRKLSQADLFSYPDPIVRPDQEGSITIAPRWLYVVGIHAIGLVLLFAVLHLTGIVPRH